MYWPLQNDVGVELDFENENNWQWILNSEEKRKQLTKGK